MGRRPPTERTQGDRTEADAALGTVRPPWLQPASVVAQEVSEKFSSIGTLEQLIT